MMFVRHTDHNTIYTIFYPTGYCSITGVAVQSRSLALFSSTVAQIDTAAEVTVSQYPYGFRPAPMRPPAASMGITPHSRYPHLTPIYCSKCGGSQIARSTQTEPQPTKTYYQNHYETTKQHPDFSTHENSNRNCETQDEIRKS